MAEKKTTASKANKSAVAVQSAPLANPPSVADLKVSFGAQKIPQAEDFAGLIDLADYGRKAVGSGKTGQGLKLETDGRLCVHVGKGLTINATTNALETTLSAEDVFHKYMIIMFSGDKIPDGWVLCDGQNLTPDLRGRFVLGGTKDDMGGVGGQLMAGDKNAKQLSVKVESTTITAKSEVKGHILTKDETPLNGGDLGGLRIVKLKDQYSVSEFGTVDMPSKMSGLVPTEKAAIPVVPVKTDSYSLLKNGDLNDGSRAVDIQPHDHDSSVTFDPHQHTATASVPYYILAFIMKT